MVRDISGKRFARRTNKSIQGIGLGGVCLAFGGVGIKSETMYDFEPKTDTKIIWMISHTYGDASSSSRLSVFAHDHLIHLDIYFINIVMANSSQALNSCRQSLLSLFEVVTKNQSYLRNGWEAARLFLVFTWVFTVSILPTVGVGWGKTTCNRYGRSCSRVPMESLHHRSPIRPWTKSCILCCAVMSETDVVVG